MGAGTNRIAVYADALNLFNASTVLSVNARYPEVSIAGYDQPVVLGDADFGRAAAAVAPRRALELLVARSALGPRPLAAS